MTGGKATLIPWEGGLCFPLEEKGGLDKNVAVKEKLLSKVEEAEDGGCCPAFYESVAKLVDQSYLCFPHRTRARSTSGHAASEDEPPRGCEASTVQSATLLTGTKGLHGHPPRKIRKKAGLVFKCRKWSLIRYRQCRKKYICKNGGADEPTVKPRLL
jgi:hypothetical protein